MEPRPCLLLLAAQAPRHARCAPPLRPLPAAAELAAAAVPAEYPAEGSEELIVWGTALKYSGGQVPACTKYAAASNGSPACESGPSVVGVEVEDAVLRSLPGPADVSVQPPPACMTPFPVMELNWEPVGHALENVYSVPHFDFHFYLVPEADVMNVTGGPEHPPPLAPLPLPPGNHYLSADAPEIKAAFAGENGVGAWNATWIWGGYHGQLQPQVTYMEPMIKRSFLMSKPDECWSIPDAPKEWAVAGYKPSTYCVMSTDDGVRVELRDFTWQHPLTAHPAGMLAWHLSSRCCAALCRHDAGCMGDQPIANASLPMVDPSAPPLPPECELPMA
ncbi:hypothetical protein ABPG75_005028 [Micractinium tetrahymenae]